MRVFNCSSESVNQSFWVTHMEARHHWPNMDFFFFFAGIRVKFYSFLMSKWCWAPSFCCFKTLITTFCLHTFQNCLTQIKVKSLMLFQTLVCRNLIRSHKLAELAVLICKSFAICQVDHKSVFHGNAASSWAKWHLTQQLFWIFRPLV